MHHENARSGSRQESIVGEISAGPGLTDEEQHKISMGNKERSTLITAHTDENKKGSLIFTINLK